MEVMALIDGPAAAIVFGGTALATLLRCGWGDVATTARVLATLGESHFDADRVRAEVAVQLQEIARDGLVRAQPHSFGDAEFDEATGALLEQRSVDALVERHEAHRRRRLGLSQAASRTLAQAAELAPVFGLAGTLISLSQLPAEGIASGNFTGAISLAVLTTLYGLLLANLLLAPLARMVDRKAQVEEAQRQALFDWITAQVAVRHPGRRQPLARAA
jgi:chemotaxis protein MotA